MEVAKAAIIKKMNPRRRSALAIVVAAVLLISMVGMASAASQRWDLDSDGVMYKGEHEEEGYVFIDRDGDFYIWTADQAAQTTVPFAAKTWTGYLDDSGMGWNYEVEIGYSDADGANFVSKGSASVLVSRDFTIAAPAFDVPEGKYLALKVTNNDIQDPMYIYTDGDSYVSYPEDYPDYSVPELPTVLLMSIGVLALIGYVAYRRKSSN